MIEAVPRKWILLAAAATFLSATPASRWAGRAPGSPAGVITIDPAQKFQTIEAGWIVGSDSGEIDEQQHRIHPAWSTIQPALINAAVNDLGLTCIMIGIWSGTEGRTDAFKDWLDGKITKDQRNALRYEIVNDNNDPNTIRPAGFHWTRTDLINTLVVAPFRAAVVARGLKPCVVLTYVDFEPSAFKHASRPAEYAEFMVAAFNHFRDTYGYVPDAIDTVLEPDWMPWWTGRSIGTAIAAAKTRLAAAGYHPAFMAPSNMNLANVVPTFDALFAVPGVRGAVTDISYHLYDGVSAAERARVASRAAANGLRTSMTELIGATHHYLFNDLTIANVSSWKQNTLAWPMPTEDDGGKYFLIEPDNTIRMADRTRYLRHYFHFVRPGAVRIGALSSAPDLNPTAFINADGRTIVVVNSLSAQSFTVGPLPAGTYGIRFTTLTQTDADAGDQVIVAGGAITASIPGAGAMTVFQR
jgi:hypothetical protein